MLEVNGFKNEMPIIFKGMQTAENKLRKPTLNMTASINGMVLARTPKNPHVGHAAKIIFNQNHEVKFYH